MIPQLLQELTQLAGTIKKSTAVNVNSQSTKQQALELGAAYFRDYRAHVVGLLTEAEALKDYDESWQQLIRLAQGNNPKTTYEKLTRKLIKITKDVNVTSHSTITEAPAIKSSSVSYSQAEQLLLDTLERLLPSAAASYKQGLTDLSSQVTRYSYRGTASEFREAFRETLDHLAPDSDVMQQTWFKLEKDQTLPTMKQKVKFILSSRGKNKTERTAAEKTVDLIEALSGEIARAVYNRASLSTHLETTKQEVEQLKRYMDAVLFDILEVAQRGA
ncbi:MAG TPA: hypothetical protein VGO68_15345 [Pyrinomonadaceae bacterium]|jgi:hypothetical protein|nr:hypothetical protein [Pyrinomonadaceae bacterium]